MKIFIQTTTALLASQLTSGRVMVESRSFISWTAHYITSEFQRDERVLQACPFPGCHTADAISEMILKLLVKWGIDKSRVHAIVRDNAANMVAGIRQCGLSAISCTIHA